MPQTQMGPYIACEQCGNCFTEERMVTCGLFEVDDSEPTHDCDHVYCVYCWPDLKRKYDHDEITYCPECDPYNVKITDEIVIEFLLRKTGMTKPQVLDQIKSAGAAEFKPKSVVAPPPPPSPPPVLSAPTEGDSIADSLFAPAKRARSG